MPNNQIDPFAKLRKMSLLEFVQSLFESAREPNVQGLYIQLYNGHRTRVLIITRSNKIYITMDDVEMGYFEEINRRGYRCSFHQKARIGIRNGLFPNEALMKSICNHPLVYFIDA
jgi:hypothetical protein